jgi:DNA-binding NarL/FixJ family response regulator
MKPLRVLLIEDNDQFREALQLLFGLRSDVEVVGALADGTRAHEVCRELDPDVVVLDNRLPGLEAVEVARAVRASCPDVALVCLTGAATEDERAALLEAGVAELLTKDEDLDTIVETLQRVAGKLPA